MAKVPFGLTAYANLGPVLASVSSPSLDAPPSATPTPVPPPARKGTPRPTAENSRKRGAAEVPKATLAKKLKNMVTEDSSSNTVASTFGSFAAENFIEGDVKLLKSRDEEAGKVMFKASLGEAFYHSLKTFTYKNNLIKDQDRSLQKLKGEVHSLNAKLGSAKKKAEEDAKAREDEIIHLKATLEESKKETKGAVESSKGEISRVKGKHEAVVAALVKERDDIYVEGFMDYLRNFLAVDPNYDWSRFPSSTPNFMANFKADNAEKIKEAEEVMHR